jgi:hypothetical protein
VRSLRNPTPVSIALLLLVAAGAIPCGALAGNPTSASKHSPPLLKSAGFGAYHIAPELMSTPAADMRDVAAKIQQVRDETKNLRGGSWPDANIPPLLWGTMLDLIYTGHRLLARQVVDMAWPKQVGGKEAFVNDLIAQMKKSPYWTAVASLGT